MEYSEKDEYLKSIKLLKEKYKDKIQIETGFEVEYLPGQEDNLLENVIMRMMRRYLNMQNI